MTRRDFFRNGVGAFTIGMAAPSFLTELAHAQGAASRSLVVLYLGGGNDALSMLIPYNDTFYNDLRSQGLLGQVLLTSFSEFGRRAYENGSVGCDHGAAGLMFVLGGAVRGGLYGTAASLNPDPQNPTLENSGGDVHYETDFRSVYARLIDSWLDADSVSLLGGDFRRPGLAFI